MIEKTVEIKGRDSTRYYIPVMSVGNITIDTKGLAIHFKFNSDIWQPEGAARFNFGAADFGFFVSNQKVLTKFLKDFRKAGGRCSVRYV